MLLTYLKCNQYSSAVVLLVPYVLNNKEISSLNYNNNLHPYASLSKRCGINRNVEVAPC